MKYICFVIVTLIAFQINAQDVKSKTYKFMLNTLLSHSVPELSIAQVHISEATLWLDAREKNEYQVSKIANAKWVGYDDFSLDRVKGIPKNEKIIVYCSVGYRSEKISEKLIKGGYTNVYNLFVGIFEWKNEGNHVLDSLNNKTENVHAYNEFWGVWLEKGKKVLGLLI